MTLRIVLDLSDVRLLWNTAPDDEGEIRICAEVGDQADPTVIHELIVSRITADRARQLGALLIGAAENRDPRDEELVRIVPIDSLAPDAEDDLEWHRRRIG